MKPGADTTGFPYLIGFIGTGHQRHDVGAPLAFQRGATGDQWFSWHRHPCTTIDDYDAPPVPKSRRERGPPRAPCPVRMLLPMPDGGNGLGVGLRQHANAGCGTALTTAARRGFPGLPDDYSS